MTDSNIIDMFAKRDEKIEERFQSIEQKVDSMCGYLKGVVDSNERLISLFTKALYVISFIAISAVGAIIIGAIGESGFKTLRDQVPKVSYAIPTDHHDLDYWQNGHKA